MPRTRCCTPSLTTSWFSEAIPNDPEFARQWSLHNTGQLGTPADRDINAPEGWDITTGSNSVVVAVIDSGIDYNHEDLAANVYTNPAECTPDGIDNDGNGYADDCHGIDAVNGDSDPLDDEGHGTMVSGVIGAVGNNGIGVAGVAWNVKLLPCKFTDTTGSGDTADAITCLDYVAAMRDRGVNIVASNNSWGNSLPSEALLDAIDAQLQRGILFIAPAGNDYREQRLVSAVSVHLFQAQRVVHLRARHVGNPRAVLGLRPRDGADERARRGHSHHGNGQ